MKQLRDFFFCLGMVIGTASIVHAQSLPKPENLRVFVPSQSYVHGQEIGPHNTGWRGLGLSLDDLIPHSGVFTEPGVYENLDINGPIQIKADNVTIRGFRVRYTGSTYGAQYSPTWGSGFSNATLEYGEIIGNPTQSGNSGGIGVVLVGPSQTTRRLHIRGFRVGMHLYGNDRAENNYVENLHYTPGSHNTSWSIRGSNVVVQGNHLTDGNSAAMAIYANEPIHNVDMIDNFWQTPKAHYCVNFGLTGSKAGAAASDHFRVINNIFGQDYSPVCGQGAAYRSWTNDRPGNEWRDNQMADGTPL